MTMRAIVQDAPGKAETLRLGRVARPVPQAGQLLVRVRAAGVNRADILQREGHYPPPPGASSLLGLEIAGEVEAVCGESAFATGDAVMGLVPGGGYAEYAVLDAALALPVPQGMRWEEAASLPEAWMTAWLNLVEVGQLNAGERFLVHAGASGVGAAAIQLARLLGATVFAGAGSGAKLEFCRQLGAHQCYDRHQQASFADGVREWGGADLILDPVGGSSLADNIACLNMDGRLVLIGVMGGARAEVNLAQMLMKRLTLRGSTLRNQPLAVKARLARALADTVLPAFADGRLRPTVDAVYPLAEVADAHRHMESNRNLGKIIISID
jgi:NADPH2:quinone reductase